MSDLTLAEYRPRSELVLPDHTPRQSRYPAIDFHTHFGAVYCDLYGKRHDLDENVRIFREHGIRKVVNLDGFFDGFLGLTVEGVMAALSRYPEFFATFVTVNTELAKGPGFETSVRRHLERSKALGARGIKLFKHVSIMLPDGKGSFAPGRNILPDDPRLEVIWATAAELELPVLIHIADPVAFFRPVDGSNERYEELRGHPDWVYSTPGLYRFEELMEAQERLLSTNPRTTFVVAHGGSYPENLAQVSAWLDRYPNMQVDIAERIAELGRQPYTARRFFLRHQDRILFGTDAYPGEMHRRYTPYFRFLETWDEYFDWSGFNTRWKIYGIGLEDEVLRKIYYGNAERILAS